jgi:hypothetical protein
VKFHGKKSEMVAEIFGASLPGPRRPKRTPVEQRMKKICEQRQNLYDDMMNLDRQAVDP